MATFRREARFWVHRPGLFTAATGLPIEVLTRSVIAEGTGAFRFDERSAHERAVLDLQRAIADAVEPRAAVARDWHYWMHYPDLVKEVCEVA